MCVSRIIKKPKTAQNLWLILLKIEKGSMDLFLVRQVLQAQSKFSLWVTHDKDAVFRKEGCNHGELFKTLEAHKQVTHV